MGSLFILRCDRIPVMLTCYQQLTLWAELTHNEDVKIRKKPIHVSPVISMLFLPLLVPLMLIGAAVSIPYAKIRRRTMMRREDRFAESMKLRGRVMDWADFVGELERGNGMLIVERSLKGPYRLWWTRDNLYETCPYPLVDWETMVFDANFDPVRDWCHEKYTSATGEAKLVTGGTKDQRRSIRGDHPLSFREDIQYVEVPPPRKS